MPNMQFMQISVAVHYSAYFGLGILYCIYKGRIDAILLRYKYGMFLGSFALSASLLPWKLVAALVGIDRKSTRLNSSHREKSRMPSSA